MPEIPKGWSSTTLGASGNLGSRRPRPFKGRRPYIATADLVGGQVLPSEIVAFAERPARADLELRPGDVLQAKMKATQKALLVGSELEGWLASTGFAQFSPQAAGNNPAYFYHYVSSARFHYLKDALCVGSTQQAISDRELSAIRLALPPLEEQVRIAEVLDTIDEAVRRTEQVIAKLRQMQRGLLEDLLTVGIDDSGVLRDPLQDRNGFKASALGEIPTCWTVSPLAGVIRIIDCKHVTPTYVEQGVPIIRPRNVRASGLDFAEVDYVTESDYRHLTDKHQPGKGDIIYSRNASFGVPCYIDSDVRFCIGQDVVILTESAADTRFVFMVLMSRIIEKQVRRSSAGSTFGRINLSEIRGLQVPVPPLPEQVLIAEVYAAHERRVRGEIALCAKLRETKLGLTKDLLEGRVLVPASEVVHA